MADVPSDASPSPRPILIAGYYGFGNTGDEAILAALLRDLRALDLPLAPTVVSGRPAETAALHGTDALLWTDIPALIAAARASALIILGGGGLFHDYHGFDPGTALTSDHAGLAFYGTFPLLAALLDRPLLLYGVGVGPLFSDDGRAWTRAAFAQADRATVRDRASRDLLQSLGLPADRVEVAADPAFRLPPAEPARVQHCLAEVGLADPPRPLIGVAPRPWSVGVDPDAWLAAVARALDAFLERHGGSVLFLPFQASSDPSAQDAAAVARIRGQMRRADRTAVLPAPAPPAEMAGLIAACDLVLAVRLHAAIFAAAAGVPVVGLAYDPKVRGVLAELELPAQALDLAPAGLSALPPALTAAWEHRAVLSAHLRTAAARLAVRAARPARHAQELLTAPPPPRPALDPAVAALLPPLVLALSLRLHERTQWARRASEDAAVRDQIIRDLQRGLDEMTAWARSSAEAVAQRDQTIQELQAQIARQEEALADLRAQLANAHAQLEAIRATRAYRAYALLKRGLQSVRGERNGAE